jgi:xylulokinase
MPLLLGIDLGTTGCKAALYDEHGALAGESYLEYGLITLSPVMIEQDPLAWWDLTCRAVRGAIAAADARPADVRALAISSQGISFLLVDGAGRPLGNAINWLDGRATAECAAILEQIDRERLFRITGKRAAPFYVLPKLLWLRRHRPDAWGAASKLLMGQDYLVYRMCGQSVTDHSLAGGTMLYDLQGLDWCDELLSTFDIPRDLLPEIRWAGTLAGQLLPAAAAELGLLPGTPVVVGGQDQKCAALGAGIADGTATISLGTASAIEQIMDWPLTDPLQRVPSFTFVQPERWVLEAVVGTSAGALRWYRDTMARGISYAALDVEAAQIPPGADGVMFLPHLTGAGSPYWVTAGRGTFHGLSLATTPGHLTRAVLEGVAYQLAANLAVTQDLAGPVGQTILFGGGARSGLWRQIIADVCNRPVAWTPTVETAGLGAAMLAGLGCGLFASRAEARDALAAALTYLEPDPACVPLYAAAFARYRRAEAALLEIAAHASQ